MISKFNKIISFSEISLKVPLCFFLQAIFLETRSSERVSSSSQNLTRTCNNYSNDLCNQIHGNDQYPLTWFINFWLEGIYHRLNLSAFISVVWINEVHLLSCILLKTSLAILAFPNLGINNLLFLLIHFQKDLSDQSAFEKKTRVAIPKIGLAILLERNSRIGLSKPGNLNFSLWKELVKSFKSVSKYFG